MLPYVKGKGTHGSQSIGLNRKEILESNQPPVYVSPVYQQVAAEAQ